MTSLFGCGWMCRLCGRESCGDCFELIHELTSDEPPTSDAQRVARQQRRARSFSGHILLACTKRNEHSYSDFTPVSRFERTELIGAISQMELAIGEDVPGRSDSMLALSESSGGSATAIDSRSNSDPSSDSLLISKTLPLPDLQTIDRGLPIHDIRRFTTSELNEASFHPLWTEGLPILVSGLGSKLQLPWSPEYFIEKYGETNCIITECQQEANRPVTVAKFFKQFGKYEGRTEVWKLKDWPPTSDFQVQFPDLYDDFFQAVPVPNYVRRNGVLNISSHFPSNAIAPDLGMTTPATITKALTVA